MKIYHKVIFLIIIIAGGIGLFSSLLASRFMHDAFNSELRKKAQIITRMMADNITHSVIDNEVIPVANILQKIISNNIDVEYAYVVGFRGEVYAHSFENGFPRGLAMQRDDEVSFDKPHIAHFLTFKGPILDISYPLIQGMSAHVHLGMNETQAYKLVKGLRNRILITTLCITLFGILFGILISRRITYPLDRLADSMQTFGKESTVQKFSFRGGSLEVKKLATAFNRMISERIDMEASIRESEKKHRELLEGLNDAAYRMSLPDGKYEYFGRSAKKVFGYDSKQWLNNPKLISQIIHPDFIDCFKQNWADLLKGKVSETYEYKIIDPEGNERWIFQSNTGIWNDIGKLTAIEGLCRNVTNRKQAQEALKKKTHDIGERIKELKCLYAISTLFENSAIPKGENFQRIVDLIPPSWQYPEITCAQIIINNTKYKTDNFKVTKWKQSRNILVNEKKAGTVEVYYSEKMPRIDEGPFLKEERDLINEIAEQISRFIEKKQIEKKSKKLEAWLRHTQKMESIGILAGGIAHDFNNLLSPIIGMSEILLEDLPKESLEYENANEIFQAGKRAGDLVKQILTFSRRSEHKKTPIRVQKVIKEVLKLSRSTIPANIEIYQDIQQDCGLVMADPTQIHQVIMNLMTNASHAMEDKNGVIDIKLKEINLKGNELFDTELGPGLY
ncbi:MAG: PAS domain S-box protein [Desulfobacteraceae bacterium]|nr:PAS domain S-box protein [Desulfobacteraceae bacterium]